MSEYQTVREIQDKGALTGREMCEIIYHFHRCVNLKPVRTPKQIWEIHPRGELYPVIDEFKFIKYATIPVLHVIFNFLIILNE